MSSEKNSGNKRKRSVHQHDYGTKCVCCDPRCDAAMDTLLEFNPDRHAYFSIPREPKETKDKPRASAAEKKSTKVIKETANSEGFTKGCNDSCQ